MRLKAQSIDPYRNDTVHPFHDDLPYPPLLSVLHPNIHNNIVVIDDSRVPDPLLFTNGNFNDTTLDIRRNWGSLLEELDYLYDNVNVPGQHLLAGKKIYPLLFEYSGTLQKQFLTMNDALTCILTKGTYIYHGRTMNKTMVRVSTSIE